MAELRQNADLCDKLHKLEDKLYEKQMQKCWRFIFFINFAPK